MKGLPAVVGVIERRLLVNYRVDPSALERLLPHPFRPQLIAGSGLAGICLIRLGALRPAGIPAALGVTTENAAHRVAVEWDGPAGACRGVYIPRRDTSSRLTVLAGGLLFPGEHHRARFRVHEAQGRCDVSFVSVDRAASARVVTVPATSLPQTSAFGSVEEASTFFREGPLGYSARREGGPAEGLELRCATWHMEPVHVEAVASSFFGDGALFPAAGAELDSALIMRNIAAVWRAGGSLPTSEHLEGAPASQQCV